MGVATVTVDSEVTKRERDIGGDGAEGGKVEGGGGEQDVA